jgi:CelD/BcsL family acetyltransferase involved in cellulose biosynthesis
VRVGIIDTIEQLKDLHEEWDNVLASSKANTIFLTSDWIISWWEGYQPQGRIMSLVLRDHEDKAVGFAPFYVRQKKRGGVSYQALLFLGDGTNDSEYMDFFCVNGQENVFFRHILGWLCNHEKEWDVCEWNIISENSVSLPFIKEWAIKNSLFYVGNVYECSHIKLPDDYEQYLHLLSRNHRKIVRKYSNRAVKRGDFELLKVERSGLLSEGLITLFELHKKRWNSVGQEGGFADQGRVRFYERMTERFRAQGWLRLRQLNLLGRPAAAQIGFAYNGVYFALQDGFDPEFGQWRSGSVLRAMHIQELIQEGIKVYDFLGYPNPSKERWNTDLHYCYSFMIAKKTLKSLMVVRLPHSLRMIKSKIRSITPKPILAFKQKLNMRNIRSDNIL